MNYNAEVKKYLLDNIKDDFVQSHIQQIPDHRIEYFEIKSSYLGLLFEFLLRFGRFRYNKYDYSKIEETLEEIIRKYDSISLII